MTSKKLEYYHSLTPLTDFLKLDDSTYYVQVPEDSLIVISDIQGSTKAIEKGFYKLVNMLGASAIAAVINAVKQEGYDREIPFVFGGDGATALIPMECRAVVEAALVETQKRAIANFGMSLRVGLVPHHDLIKQNCPVSVAKFKLAENNFIAFFKGKGLSLAESWVKDGKYLVDPKSPTPNFDPAEGLSCRWAPLKSERGSMMSLLIKLNDDNYHPEILPGLVAHIDHVVDLEHPSSNPVKVLQLKAEKWSLATDLEARFGQGSTLLKRIGLYLVAILAWALDKKVIKIKDVSLEDYKGSLPMNSDYRKYDEVLRMVLDCDESMKKSILDILEDFHRRGLIFYGAHSSKTALMTCFVQDMKDNNHVHFIDGGDGGYAMAAIQMKLQIKKDLETKLPQITMDKNPQ
jgi:hypothetical protein